ncbi:MAG: 5-(carboxyamino)imidazole ribonucleotide mutase [Candidatus Diapherotrites archaeon]|nr:5-(carboxyamino)imidazole ribonucleotide mutase [Candidatus Diapherotrites archaeon]
MADVLVVFGSDSDKAVYEKIMSGLRDRKISAGLRICSAHRTPEALDKIVLETDAKIIVAGAGLSAALPGVIASKTIKPVIGVPVGSNYSGLDALLSIAQMPPGFPVIAAPVDDADTVVNSVEFALQQRFTVKLAGGKFNKLVKEKIDKAAEAAREIGVGFEYIKEVTPDNFKPKQEILVNVVEFGLFSPPKMQESLVLNVPVLQESTSAEALEFLEKSQCSLWVGLNRIDNALIAAAQLLNIHSGSFTEKLLQYRAALRAKAAEADKKESERFG